MAFETAKSRYALVSVCLAIVLGCTGKEGKRENAEGDAPTQDPVDKSDDPSPCLRLQTNDNSPDSEDASTTDFDDSTTTGSAGSGSGSGAGANDDTQTKSASAGTDDGCSDGGQSSADASGGADDGSGTDGSGGGGTGGTGGSWSAGPGLEGCAEQSKAWIAVKNGGAGECGAALVSWCCSEAEIVKQFPALASQLQAEFYKRQALKLYHCSYDGSETRFHWAKYENGGMRYSTVFIKGAGTLGGTAGDDCPKVSSEDLGLPQAADDSDVVQAGDDIPASIGPIANTSAEGLLAWSKEHNNFASRDASIRDTGAGAHGRAKSFYSADLKDSMGAFASQHPQGAVAILELYGASGDVLQGYAVMAKAGEATGVGSWLFYKIDGAPAFAAAPAAYGLGVEACSTCHTPSAKDHVLRANLP